MTQEYSTDLMDQERSFFPGNTISQHAAIISSHNLPWVKGREASGPGLSDAKFILEGIPHEQMSLIHGESLPSMHGSKTGSTESHLCPCDREVGRAQALSKVSEAATLFNRAHSHLQALGEPPLNAGLQHVFQLDGSLLVPLCKCIHISQSTPASKEGISVLLKGCRLVSHPCSSAYPTTSRQ